MNYEKMWDKLREKLESELHYYQHGTDCSMMESSQGQVFCFSILNYMNDIENEQKEERA